MSFIAAMSSGIATVDWPGLSPLADLRAMKPWIVQCMENEACWAKSDPLFVFRAVHGNRAGGRAATAPPWGLGRPHPTLFDLEEAAS